MAKPKKKVEEVDENEGLITKLRSLAPKGEHAGSWEVARTTDLVMSSIKYVLMTGIESFDDEVGGMPMGRMAEIYGLESCGKTALAIRCAAQAMNKQFCEVIRNEDETLTYRPLKPEECKVVVVYIDNEQSLDEDGKLNVGGQKLDVVGCRFDTTDDVFKAIDGAITFQETRLDAEAKDGIKRFMFIVVDTIASTSTRQELDQAWGVQDYPRQAQQISKALRQLARRVNRYNVCVLFTNQVRVKFQQGQQSKGAQTFAIQADDYTSVGGMALRYYTSHRVFMFSFQQKYKLVPDAKFSAGLLVGFYTKKNRLRPPLRDGRMVLLFDKHQGGFHNLFSKLETLVFLGFIEVATTKNTGYTLKFKKNGIVPTTFDPSKVETTLEEDEDMPKARRGSSRKDPEFNYRSEWPQFYTDHKEDIDKLWDAAMAYAMSTEGLEGGVQVVEEEHATIPEEDNG